MFLIKCEPLPDLGCYRLCEGVVIEGISIPAGYAWNGASVPGPLWPLIGSPFDPRFMAPSLVHDRVYETGELSRLEADRCFRKLLLHNGVEEDLARIMYVGVRIGAALFYKKKGLTHA